MSHETLNLKQAAEHVHLDANELRHVAQRGEVAATKRGDEWYFDHQALDEWAQRNLLEASERELRKRHRAMMDENRRAHRTDWCVADLFRTASVDLAVQAKAKAGIVRDLSDLAVRSELVYDEEGLFRAVLEREEAASTAIGGEVALLHPRFHDPYQFEESFVAYGRSERLIFFGASDGGGTRHFFLVCSTDHEEHLRILARLAMLVRETNLTERLSEADSPEAVIEAVRACEAELG